MDRSIRVGRRSLVLAIILAVVSTFLFRTIGPERGPEPREDQEKRISPGSFAIVGTPLQARVDHGLPPMLLNEAG
jgi:hypothetical protein